MQSYKFDGDIDESNLIPCPDTGILKMDDGCDPKVRVDLDKNDMLAGVFTQNCGKVELIWPNIEHAFVLEGEVTIEYLDTNEKVTYGPGEGWVIEKGRHVLWEVKSPKFVKSFFNVIEEG